MSAGIAKPANPSAHVDPKSAPLKEIPDVLVDPRTMKRYARGRFLGKGGFAKCYEITDMETKQVFAGKIVPKSLILKQHQREKMTSEIAIHKSLDHANVVGFHGFFENDDFVFVVLEICRRRVSVCVFVWGKIDAIFPVSTLLRANGYDGRLFRCPPSAGGGSFKMREKQREFWMESFESYNCNV